MFLVLFSMGLDPGRTLEWGAQGMGIIVVDVYKFVVWGKYKEFWGGRYQAYVYYVRQKDATNYLWPKIV